MNYENPTGCFESPTLAKKLRRPDAKLESLRHEPNNPSQKGKSQTTKQNSHKPTKKLSLPPLTHKQKNSESQIKRKIAQAQKTKPNKKIKRANSKRHLPCRHRANKK
jgi:hypothetical protein